MVEIVLSRSFVEGGFISGIIAGVLMFIGAGYALIFGGSPLLRAGWVLSNLMLALAFALSIFSWTALYAVHGGRCGAAGGFGYFLLVLGSALSAGACMAEAAVGRILLPLQSFSLLRPNELLVSSLAVAAITLFALGAFLFGMFSGGRLLAGQAVIAASGLFMLLGVITGLRYWTQIDLFLVVFAVGQVWLSAETAASPDC